MPVLISLSLKLPSCCRKEARINAVAFLRELSIWMWTFLSLTVRFCSNGGEALDWHITIQWMSSDAAKKKNNLISVSVVMQSSVSVLKRRQRMQNKRPTSSVRPSHDQDRSVSRPRQNRDLERLRPSQFNCEKIVVRHCRMSKQIQTRRSWNQLILLLPSTLYNRFFCASIRFSGFLLSSHTNHHKECTKPLFSTVISLQWSSLLALDKCGRVQDLKKRQISSYCPIFRFITEPLPLLRHSFISLTPTFNSTENQKTRIHRPYPVTKRTKKEMNFPLKSDSLSSSL